MHKFVIRLLLLIFIGAYGAVTSLQSSHSDISADFIAISSPSAVPVSNIKATYDHFVKGLAFSHASSARCLADCGLVVDIKLPARNFSKPGHRLSSHLAKVFDPANDHFRPPIIGFQLAAVRSEQLT